MGTQGSATQVQGANSESQDDADYCFTWNFCLHPQHARSRVWVPWLSSPTTLCEGARDNQVSACKLVPEKTCATETVKIGEKITGFEKGECKEIEVCAPAYGYHGHHGYHGKRSAEADPGYVHACTKVTKEVCKSVPVKVDVTKDIETCTEVAKEVCEEVEKVVPKVTCKTATIKH